MLFHRSAIAGPIAAAALLATSGMAVAGGKVCTGHNLFDELRRTDAATAARVRAEADDAKNGKTLLWKIENIDKPDHPPSYLFGTLKVSDDRLKTLPETVEQALSVSNRIATGGEDMTPPRIVEAMGVMRNALLPEPKARLATLLDHDDAERTSAILAKSDVPKDWQARVEPWVVMMMTPPSDCEIERARQGSLTFDAEMARQAENRGVGTFGLESAEMELSALAAVPVDEQVSLLKAKLAGRDRFDDWSETQVQLYLLRDIGALWPLEAAIAQSRGADAKALETYHQNMFDERNVRLRDRAMMHLATGGVFIAVGAARLPGERGMVELLRDAGYKMTAIE